MGRQFIDNIIEINPGVYIPNCVINYASDTIHNVTVDGHVYSRTEREIKQFNSVEHWKTNHSTDNCWMKKVFDFSWIGLTQFEIWDYHGFVSQTAIDAALRTTWNYSEIIKNQLFYDYENPIQMKKEYKTKPTEYWTAFEIKRKGIVDKTIISDVFCIKFSNVDRLNWLFKYNMVAVWLESERLTVMIPIRVFLQSNINEFPAAIIESIKKDWVDKQLVQYRFYDFNFPSFLLTKKLEDSERLTILLDFFKVKLKNKRYVTS